MIELALVLVRFSYYFTFAFCMLCAFLGGVSAQERKSKRGIAIALFLMVLTAMQFVGTFVILWSTH